MSFTAPGECENLHPDEYIQLVKRTLLDEPDVPLSPKETMQIWCAMGLAGEAGEATDHIKKGIFHRHGIDKDKLIKELGDVLWYVAALCEKFDISLEGVMNKNIEKLRERYPDGYKSEDSIKRKE